MRVSLPEDVAALVASRLVVGLCKQSSVASTTILTQLTSVGEERTSWIGRLSTSQMVSWMCGGAIGGMLAIVHSALPMAIAVLTYIALLLLVHLMVPQVHAGHGTEQTARVVQRPSFHESLREVLSQWGLLRVVVMRASFVIAFGMSHVQRSLYEFVLHCASPHRVYLWAHHPPSCASL